MEEPSKDDFFPLYFRTQRVPACAYFTADLIIGDADPDPDELAAVENHYPRGETVTPGPGGYYIRPRGNTVFTVLSTDPNARIQANDFVFSIGVGSFTFPISTCGFYDFKLFHQGEVKLEYRHVSSDLEEIFKKTVFNVVLHNANRVRCTGFVERGALLITQFPRITPINGSDNGEQRRARIEKLLQAGLLHRTPTDGDTGKKGLNQWDLVGLRQDAKFLLYAYVGERLHSIFVSCDDDTDSILESVRDLTPKITSTERSEVTNEAWAVVEKHYDDDLGFNTDQGDDQERLFRRGRVIVHLPWTYIVDVAGQ